MYSIEDSEDSDGSEVEETKFLFMGLDTQASNSDLLAPLKNLRNVVKIIYGQILSSVSWKLNF